MASPGRGKEGLRLWERLGELQDKTYKAPMPPRTGIHFSGSQGASLSLERGSSALNLAPPPTPRVMWASHFVSGASVP